MWLQYVLLTGLIVGATPESWPGFLGVGRSSIAPTGIPLEWSPTKNQAWSAALPGHGQSSPVIWNDRAYVTSVDGPMKDHLIVSAVALADGKLLWQKSFDTTDPVKNGTFVSRAAPTPVVDAAGVYCFFESGDLLALDHAGAVRWQKSLSKQYGKFQNEYGIAASPIQTLDRLVLLIDHPGPSYLIAIEKTDGKELWKRERKSRGSWTSPMLLSVDGQQQVLCSSAGTIDGYEIQDGKLLWTHESVGGNRICSPWVFGNGLFLNGAQTSREFSDEASVKQSNFAMKVSKRGTEWVSEIVWKTTDASPSMASPMEHAGCAYWINRTGAVFCFDARTGKQHYMQRIQQSPWATPLAVDGRVYMFGKDGLTTVLAAGPEFKILAENQLWDPNSIKTDQSIIDRETDPKRRAGAAMHAKPEIYGVAGVTGSLLIRTGNRLFCVREGTK